MFSAASWAVETGIGVVGFCVVDSSCYIYLAGCCQIPIASSLEAEVKALLVALYCAGLENHNISKVFVGGSELMKIIEGVDCENA